MVKLIVSCFYLIKLLFIYSFILFFHSGHFYSASSSQLRTTLRSSRLQHGYFIGVSRRSAQATVHVGKGLAQGPYMAARAGFEPTTLRLKAIDSTKAPSCPTIDCQKSTLTGACRPIFISYMYLRIQFVIITNSIGRDIVSARQSKPMRCETQIEPRV